ncbi:MAG: hypothetical protein ACHQX1_00570 [Candidatus Micrarchaeales archaeon]
MATPPSATKSKMSETEKSDLIRNSKTGTELNENLTKIGGLTFNERFYSGKELVATVTVLAWKRGYWSGVINDPSGMVDEDEWSPGSAPSTRPDFSIPEAYYHDEEFDRHFVLVDGIAEAAMFQINIVPPTYGLRDKVSELLGMIGTTNDITLRATSPTT